MAISFVYQDDATATVKTGHVLSFHSSGDEFVLLPPAYYGSDCSQKHIKSETTSLG